MFQGQGVWLSSTSALTLMLWICDLDWKTFRVLWSSQAMSDYCLPGQSLEFNIEVIGHDFKDIKIKVNCWYTEMYSWWYWCFCREILDLGAAWGENLFYNVWTGKLQIILHILGFIDLSLSIEENLLQIRLKGCKGWSTKVFWRWGLCWPRPACLLEQFEQSCLFTVWHLFRSAKAWSNCCAGWSEGWFGIRLISTWVVLWKM